MLEGLVTCRLSLASLCLAVQVDARRAGKLLSLSRWAGGLERERAALNVRARVLVPKTKAQGVSAW